jgi:hypothetical protein
METQSNYPAPKSTNEIHEQEKWYNNKVKLGLSILFWPALAYGLYKTDLLDKRKKQIIGSIAIFILIMGALKNGGSSIQSSNPENMVKETVVEYIKENSGDPNSYSSISWGKVEQMPNGNYKVKHYFNSRVSAGVVITQICEFVVDKDSGKVIAQIRLA